MREKRSHGPKVHSSLPPAGEKLAFLAQSSIFRHLTTDEMTELDRITTWTTCLPGRILYRPGETGSGLFLLASGSVQLYHLSTDGRKLITSLLQAGDCFGELSFLSQRNQMSFAEVIEEARLSMIARNDAEALLLRKPAIALELLRIQGQRSMQLEIQLVDTTFKSTAARLAALLLQLAQPTEKANGMLVVEGLSQEALAERLGVYRETVSAALRELKELGAIEPGRKSISISSTQLLEEAARGGTRGIDRTSRESSG